jgi:hypothetical protein
MTKKQFIIWLEVGIALVAAFAVFQFVVDNPARAYGPNLVERIAIRSVLLLVALGTVFGSCLAYIAAGKAKSVVAKVLYFLLIPGLVLVMWGALLMLLMSFSY